MAKINNTTALIIGGAVVVVAGMAIAAYIANQQLNKAEDAIGNEINNITDTAKEYYNEVTGFPGRVADDVTSTVGGWWDSLKSALGYGSSDSASTDNATPPDYTLDADPAFYDEGGNDTANVAKGAASGGFLSWLFGD